MYFILITQLLMTSLAIKTGELHESDKNPSNRTNCLPYTLKTPVNMETGVNKALSQVAALSEHEYKSKDKQTLSLYEEKSELIKPPENNGWKRLTSYLSSGSNLNKQDVTYLTKTPNLHSQHLQHSSSLFGSVNFFLIQNLFVLIHFAVLLYILFGSVTLLHRLLSLPTSSINAIGDVYGGNFYKSEL